MALLVRRALWSTLPVTLLLACATGAEETLTSVSGFGGSNPQPSDPAGSTSDAQPTSTTGRPDEGMTGRETMDMRETTTGLTEAGTISTGALTGDSSTGGDESSSGEVVLCGNGMIDAPEECDGANLDAMDCSTLGFTGGALTCTPQCTFDKSKCTSPSCGDGTLDPGEECDCGQQGTNCTAPQLGNAACTTLPSPNGGNYSAGTLACNSPASCSFNKAACVYCGDGVKNGAEACDGGDLGGQTCQSQGFASGNLTCASCAFSTAGCTKCGNGVVDGGEVCDGGNFNGQTCQGIDPNKFAGGTLICDNCSQIGTGGCSSGNCCTVGGAGCQVPNIQSCVCNLDAFCCNNSWDQQCVNEAKNPCGAQCP
jgi:hypothetical protein